MNLEKRIHSFVALGQFLRSPEGKEALSHWAQRAYSLNTWFTPENCEKALNTIAQQFLTEQKLLAWTGRYFLEPIQSKKIGVIMPGNLPTEGFHDMLCVLLSGHELFGKLSPQDPVLLKELANVLKQIDSHWDSVLHFDEKLNRTDAIIATPSGKSSEPFRQYFGNKPHIIRKHRLSCAVLNGEETPEELARLGDDIFQYFGLGSRNVSKLFVPAGYQFDHFFEAVQPYEKIAFHAKYHNNYDYNKSILLVNNVPHLDNGFALLTQNEELISRISVIYFEEYSNFQSLNTRINHQKEKIQYVVSRKKWYPDSIEIGQTQNSGLLDYADEVDTMQFLSRLSS